MEAAVVVDKRLFGKLKVKVDPAPRICQIEELEEVAKVKLGPLREFMVVVAPPPEAVKETAPVEVAIVIPEPVKVKAGPEAPLIVVVAEEPPPDPQEEDQALIVPLVFKQLPLEGVGASWSEFSVDTP